uniref:Transmembrane protein n=1 Tax=Spironucleus salmonicida TaxID=348837 RepID=V6LE68_9EUKA|eukprot:EST42767.1 Hypothetical protein SS50377_17634 [Spironucleus salmonicida]
MSGTRPGKQYAIFIFLVIIFIYLYGYLVCYKMLHKQPACHHALRILLTIACNALRFRVLQDQNKGGRSSNKRIVPIPSCNIWVLWLLISMRDGEENTKLDLCSIELQSLQALTSSTQNQKFV